MGAYAPESAKWEKTRIRKNQQAYIMELATEKWVHMLRNNQEVVARVLTMRKRKKK